MCFVECMYVCCYSCVQSKWTLSHDSSYLWNYYERKTVLSMASCSLEGFSSKDFCFDLVIVSIINPRNHSTCICTVWLFPFIECLSFSFTFTDTVTVIDTHIISTYMCGPLHCTVVCVGTFSQCFAHTFTVRQLLFLSGSYTISLCIQEWVSPCKLLQ